MNTTTGTTSWVRTGRWVFSPLDCSAHLTVGEGDQTAATAEQEDRRLLIGWRCPHCHAIFLIDSDTAAGPARHDE